MLHTADNEIGDALLAPASSDLVVESAPWSAERLRRTIEALGIRFARSVDSVDEAPVVAEITALVHAGAAGAAVLACAFACLARSKEWGPALALGPWSGSFLVTLCGGGLERFADLDDLTHGARFAELARLQEAFLSLLALGTAGTPNFLVCMAPPDQLADDLNELLPDCQVSMLPTTNSVTRLQLVDRSSLHIMTGSADLSLPSVVRPAAAWALHCVASMSWRVFCLATAAVEERTGQRIDWLTEGGPDAAPAGSQFHPVLQWLDDVPSLAPTMGGKAAAHASLSNLTRESGTTADPVAETPPGIAPGLDEDAPLPAFNALSTRLALLQQLTFLAEAHPASVWAALLACTPANSRGAVADAARAAGVQTLPAFMPTPVPDRQGEEETVLQISPDREDRLEPRADSTAMAETPERSARTLLLAGELIVLSSEGSQSDGEPVHVARGAPVSGTGAAPDQRSPYTPVEREGALLLVANDLVREVAPGVVTVRLSLSGNEDGDLALVDAVREVLERFPGPHRGALELHYAQHQRLLPLGKGVAWTAEVQAALATLVGEHAITFRQAPEA